MSPKKTNALPNAGELHTAEQQQKARACIRLARSRYFALVFCGDIGLERGQCRTKAIPDSVRLALPRPPNLDSQYRTE